MLAMQRTFLQHNDFISYQSSLPMDTYSAIYNQTNSLNYRISQIPGKPPLLRETTMRCGIAKAFFL